MRLPLRAFEAAAVAALVAAEVVLLARRFGTATNYDEGVYLASLDALQRGERLGEDVFASQPPGLYVLLEALAWLFGDSVDDVRAGMLAVAVLGSLAAYATGRILAGAAGGLTALALLVVAPPFPTEAARVAADTPSVALALVAVALAAASSRARPRADVALAALAGAALAAALSVKLLVLPAVLPVALLLALGERRGRAAAAAAGGAVVVAAALAAAFFGALDELWDTAVGFHGDARDLPGETLADNADDVAHFLDFRTPFAVLAAVALAAAIAVRAPRRVWALWTWPLASALFLIWHRPLIDHHFVLLAGALSLAAGTTLGLAAARVPRPAAGAAAAAALIVLLAGGYAQETRRLNRNDAPEPAAVVAAVDALRERTSPAADVVSDLPIVPVLAGRRLPGDLVDTSVIRFRAGAIDDADVLSAVDPGVEAVVAGRVFLQQPDLLAALRGRFPRRTAYDGITIFWR